jgi:hypothetical protein
VAGTNGSNGGEYGTRALPQASGKWLPQIENEMVLRDEEAVAQRPRRETNDGVAGGKSESSLRVAKRLGLANTTIWAAE